MTALQQHLKDLEDLLNVKSLQINVEILIIHNIKYVK